MSKKRNPQLNIKLTETEADEVLDALETMSKVADLLDTSGKSSKRADSARMNFGDAISVAIEETVTSSLTEVPRKKKISDRISPLNDVERSVLRELLEQLDATFTTEIEIPESRATRLVVEEAEGFFYGHGSLNADIVGKGKSRKIVTSSAALIPYLRRKLISSEFRGRK